MRQLIIIVFVLGLALPAWARPGFTIGLGLGGSSTGGGKVALTRLTPEPGTPPVTSIGYVPTTDIGGGLSPMLHLGFNILGYAALELRATGHWHDLFNAKTRNWTASAHIGARAYPMWHWQGKLPKYIQPLEPSLFLGWGSTWQGYAPNTSEEVAYSTFKSLRFGGSLEYFIVSFFKVSLDYYFVRAPFGTFIFDADKSWNYGIDPPAVVGYHQLYVVATFQFGPAQEPVRYQDKESEPAPEITPAPDPEPGAEPAQVEFET